MSRRAFALGGAATVVLALVAYAAFEAGVERGRTNASGTVAAVNATPAAPSVTASSPPTKAGDVNPSTGKRVLYWHDPMVPGPKFDKPGKSPFMDMQLAPVYADGGGDDSSVSVSSRVQQNLGVRTAPVKQGTMSMTVEAVGSTAYNERDVALGHAR